MTVNSLNKLVCSQSAWNMDAKSRFMEGIITVASCCPWAWAMPSGSEPLMDSGELQNDYTTVHSNMYRLFGSQSVNMTTPTTNMPWNAAWTRGSFTQLGSPGAGALYTRRHTMPSVYSFTTPTGMILETAYQAWVDLQEVYYNSTNSFYTLYNTQSYPLGCPQLYGGEALWESNILANCQGNYSLLFSGSVIGVSAQASTTVDPSYNKYENYNERLRLKNSDFSIIPEFRISEFMDFYVVDNAGDFLVPNPTEFAIAGVSGSDPLWIPGRNNMATLVDANEIKNSSQDFFYKVFSNSDFMKHYKQIKDDHSEIVDPTTITLRCEGLLKLLPYDGFYPAERTLQLAHQLSQSMSPQIEVGLLGADDSTVAQLSASFSGVDGLAFLKRPTFSTLFSPGILYNTIKAGLAVDYPIYTSSFSIVQYTTPNYTSDQWLGETGSYIFALGTGSNSSGTFDYRIPFEALLEVEKFYKNLSIMDMEAHPDASYNFSFFAPGLAPSSETYWDALRNQYNGGSDFTLYQRGMHNFLAEVPEFFLEDGAFTTITSNPQSQFQPVVSGNFYAMRVTLRRTMTKPRVWSTANLGQNNKPIINYTVPQDPIVLNGPQRSVYSTRNVGVTSSFFNETATYENFTLYSRNSAFGPPVAATQSLAQGWTSSGSISGTFMNAYKIGSKITDATNGFYCPFTPAYKDGEAWADIVFKAPRTGRPTIAEIENNCMVNLWRIDALLGIDTAPASYLNIFGQAANNYTGTGGAYDSGTYFYGNARQNGIWCGGGAEEVSGVDSPLDCAHANLNSMQLDASINLFGMARNRWHIQPKFETPHYNFNNIRSGNNFIKTPATPFVLNLGINLNSGTYEKPPYNTVSIPTNGSESVPRGMWHQFGTTESEKGIYLEVDDVPRIWWTDRSTVLPSVPSQPFTPGYTMGATPYQPGAAFGNITPSQWYGGPYSRTDDFPESLADIVGMKSSFKMGNTAQGKTISEAIVAVPFIVEEGERKFFPIPENTIRLAMGDLGDTSAASQAVATAQAAAAATNMALEESINEDTISATEQASATAIAAANAAAAVLSQNEEAMPATSIIEMVEKMKRYILPPRMDFVTHIGKIRPFAMYIFEFEYTLSQCELSKIWQNVLPDIGTRFISQEVSISHQLLANELMGNFQGTQQESLKDEVQWMVFKAKRRANNNYYSKVSKYQADPSKIQQYDYSYNWPYDYFSLIEFAKIEATVGFGTENNENKDMNEFVEYGGGDILNTGVRATRPLNPVVDKTRSAINNLTNDELKQEQQTKRQQDRADSLARGPFGGTKKK